MVPIWVWHMEGVCREIWASKATESTPWIPTDVQRLPKIHLWDKDDPLGTLCPAGPTGPSHTWQVSQDLYEDMTAFIPSFEPLKMIYMHLRLIWRPKGSLVCPHTHWEHHKSTTWKTRGHSLVNHILRSLFIIMALLDIIRHFGGPHDMHILLFDLLRGLLFHL